MRMTTLAKIEKEDPATVLLLFREFVTRNVTQWETGAGDHAHPIWALVADALGTTNNTEIRNGPLWHFIQPHNRRPLDRMDEKLAAFAPAPRYHSGTVPGLEPGEQATIISPAVEDDDIG